MPYLPLPMIIRRSQLVSLLVSLLGSLLHTAAGVTLPELPRERVDTTYPTIGRLITVRVGDDLQRAIDSAQGGDTLLLQAGATFRGNFRLRKKATHGVIVLRTATPDSQLPQGRRVTPAMRALLARIETPNASPAITTEQGASNYRLVGLEVTTTAPYLYNLVFLDGAPNASLAAMPENIIIDRSYIHGDPRYYCRRGVAMNGRRMAIIDSYIADIQATEDAQAAGGWDGTGPFLIANNFLSATGQNAGFGGALPVMKNVIAEDVEITGNHFFKPLSWKRDHASYAGKSWLIKSHFQLKGARRVVIENNLFENNWADGQDGYAIQLTVRTEGGAAPWMTIEDLTFRYNWIRNSGAGFNISGIDDGREIGEKTARVLIEHNVLEHLGPTAAWGNDGLPFQLLNRPEDLTIRHNTIVKTGSSIAKMPASATPGVRFTFTDNIAQFNTYGFFCTGSTDVSKELAICAPGAMLENNVIVGSGLTQSFRNLPSASATIVTSHEEVGFTDYARSDYRLAPSSRFAARPDPPGANIAALTIARDKAILGSGSHSTSPSTLTPTTPPLAPPPAAPTPTVPAIPSVDALLPLAGAGNGSTFTATFSHGGGVGQHYLGYLLFLPTPNVTKYTAKGSCLVEHNQISNGLRLINDAGDDWLGPISGVPLGPSAGFLQNAQCTINVAGATRTIVGTTVRVTVPVHFKGTLTPVVATFLQAFDVTGKYTGMTQFGTWSPAISATRRGPSMSSTTRRDGAIMTITTTAAHTDGANALAMLTVLISSRIVGGVPCQIVYFPSSRSLNLINDAGSALVGPGVVPGTSGTLSNTRCTIDASLVAVSATSSAVTLALPVTLAATGEHVYVNAFDTTGLTTHWLSGVAP